MENETHFKCTFYLTTRDTEICNYNYDTLVKYYGAKTLMSKLELKRRWHHYHLYFEFRFQYK